MFNDPRVDKQIRDLPAKASAQIVWVIDLFERKSFELTEVHLKKLQRNLWELRAGRWRLLFGLVKNIAVGVNLFLKKSRKTPQKEIKKALQRLEQYL